MTEKPRKVPCRRRESFQEHPYRWHYDLTPDERAAAITLGAVEVSTRELVRTMRARRQ